jgi:hypothetical protein
MMTRVDSYKEGGGGTRELDKYTLTPLLLFAVLHTESCSLSLSLLGGQSTSMG